MTNVLIVEDERTARELYTFYISSASDRYCLREMIANAANAAAICLRHDIDLILMDVCTADNESGLDAAAQIKKLQPHIKIIIITAAPEYRFLDKAREAGAESFWYKEVSSENLLDVMDRTMAGESVYPDETPSVKIGLASNDEFTKKEMQVLFYIVQGKSMPEIADIMGVDYTTTRTHLRNLKDKAGVKTISELAVLAVRTKLVLPEF